MRRSGCCANFIVLASARISLKYSLARTRSNPQEIVLNWPKVSCLFLLLFFFFFLFFSFLRLCCCVYTWKISSSYHFTICSINAFFTFSRVSSLLLSSTFTYCQWPRVVGYFNVHVSNCKRLQFLSSSSKSHDYFCCWWI